METSTTMDLQEIVMLAAALSFASKHPRDVLREAVTAKMLEPPAYAFPAEREELEAVATICREHSKALHALLLDPDNYAKMLAHNEQAMKLRQQDAAKN